jgi:hypothetical protein
MTPRDKAEQLIIKYMPLFPSWVYLEQLWIQENQYTMDKHAKKAAIIAVEELIKETNYNNTGNALKSAREDYWEQVKFHIENY